MGIHVTDVASHLQQDSPIDIDAQKKKFSIPQRHMLPEELFKKLSLDENKTRKTISMIFHSCTLPRHVESECWFISIINRNSNFMSLTIS